MSALTQWIALNVPHPDALNESDLVLPDGSAVGLYDLFDIWQPDWRNYTQSQLGAIPAEDLPKLDPDAPCQHPDFEAGVSIQRLVDDAMQPVGYYAEIQVACKVCDERWRWTGVKPGLSPAEPRMSVDGLTLLAPFRPASADQDFGMSLPGFDVNVIGPDLGHERTAAAVRKRALEDAAEMVRSHVEPTTSVATRRVLRRLTAQLDKMAKQAT